MLAAGLLILALVLSVWSYFRREQREASAPEPVRAAAPSSNDNGQSAATSQSPPGQTPPAQHPPSAILDAKPINADAPAAAGAFSVTIKANDDSWVAIAADGKTVAADSLLSGGTTRTIQANREIVIKAGNVGALEISFNGKKLQRQGQDGQVKTLTFGTEGLVAPPASTKPVSPQGN
jgi:cytoskeletal protein RodZ